MNAIKEAVMAATVRFPERGGQGVLVPGGLILTAAHVVNWTHTGRMALGDDKEFIQPVIAGGAQLLIYPLAVEPVADLAVLGALDGQWAPEPYEAFWQFCKTTPAVKLATAEFPFDNRKPTPIPAHVLTHTGRWISGCVKQMMTDAHNLVLVPDEQIESGTSGGPVVTDDGLLLGVVSWTGASMGSIPRPHLTAPVWVVRQIEDAAAEGIMAEFSVWMEGYDVTGNAAGAKLIGTVEADTFAEACARLMSKPPWNDDPSLFNREALTYWGCRLFDNETDARKAFG